MAKRVRRKRIPTRTIDLTDISSLNLPQHILKHLKIIAQKAKEGFNQNEIAKEISKSPAYVSHCYTLSNLPNAIKKVVNDGFINLPLITLLTRLYEQDSKFVEVWLKRFSVDIQLTPHDIDVLRYELLCQQVNFPTRMHKQKTIIVKYRRRFATLLSTYDDSPPPGHAWIRYLNKTNDNNVISAPLSQLRLITIH